MVSLRSIQSEFRDGMVRSGAKQPRDTLSKGCNIQEFSGRTNIAPTTPVLHLELRISPGIFEKNLNGPNAVLRGLGKLLYKKNLMYRTSGVIFFIDYCTAIRDT
jgi:hypothetical protein